VPFILKQYTAKELQSRNMSWRVTGHERDKYYKPIGDSYVDGWIFLEGNIRKDISGQRMDKQLFRLL
jgi:hypothetical protein